MNKDNRQNVFASEVFINIFPSGNYLYSQYNQYYVQFDCIEKQLIIYDSAFKNYIITIIPLLSCTVLEISYIRKLPPIKPSNYCSDKLCKATFGIRNWSYCCNRCKRYFCYNHSRDSIELLSYGTLLDSCKPQTVCVDCYRKTINELSDLQIITNSARYNNNKNNILIDEYNCFHLPNSLATSYFFALKTVESEYWFCCNSISEVDEWLRIISPYCILSTLNRARCSSKSSTSSLLSVEEEKKLVQPLNPSFQFRTGEKIAYFDSKIERYFSGIIVRKLFKDSVPLNEFEVKVDYMPNPIVFKANELYKFVNHKIRFLKGKVIGHGAHAKIYEGLNLDTGESIAIKELRIENVNVKSLSSISPEISIMQNLDHPNLIKLLGFEIDHERSIIYIIMELVPGGSITSLLKQYTTLSEPLVKIYAKQTLEGLSYLHQNRIVHRDLNCNNILVSVTGVVKIADLGISKRLLDAISNSSYNDSNFKTLVGTSRFIAPEVITESGYGRKADIWSLGCTLLNMYTGRPPFDSLSPVAALYAIGEGNIPEIPSNINNNFKDFLTKCLTRDKQLRPSCEQLLKHPWINCK